MQVFKYPPREQWNDILARPVLDSSSLFDTVKKVLEDVRQNGDKAVRAYTKQFDQVDLSTLEVSAADINTA